ncbi:MAG: AAA family ATPase, partial [Patescibacteria group bacterium]
KTELTFLLPTLRSGSRYAGRTNATSKEVTAVVGPNGSGKSNIADAIRWALGEQSVKLLRGKKSEDVIFSGSDKRARAGFAEVSLHLGNTEGDAIPYPEVALTRRLYRDGTSEYLLNGKAVRLADIQLLLARANFGERHYSVIGQGLIDSILLLSLEERKEFFDEATGVRPYQLKREQALNKLNATEANLREAELLVNEIEPRLRTLRRAVGRLSERETIEAELHHLQHCYYGTLWKELAEKRAAEETRAGKLEATLFEAREAVEVMRTKFARLEKEKPRSEKIGELQEAYRVALERHANLRERELTLRAMLERSRAGMQVKTIPVPLPEIIIELEAVIAAHEEARLMTEVGALHAHVAKTLERIRTLHERLRSTAPKAAADDPKLLKELNSLAAELTALETETAKLQAEIQAVTRAAETGRGEIFSIQRELMRAEDQLRVAEAAMNEARVELARLDTRLEALESEMTAELRERVARVRSESAQLPVGVGTAELLPRIQKLKYQMEQIGGIDPDVVKEHGETSERHEFLTTQITDLRTALRELEQVIEELDETIDRQFQSAFRAIAEEFERYFRILFGGGAARLERKKIEEETVPQEEGAEEKEEPGLHERLKAQKFMVEITASPPGKRVKSLQALSGGERALTAIALVCAIISVTPSPFVVMDEVDAALDEFNSIRFASIVSELSTKTQCIIITHNRATMEKARIMYGVTMGEDGSSRILSVKFEELDAEKQVS